MNKDTPIHSSLISIMLSAAIFPGLVLLMNMFRWSLVDILTPFIEPLLELVVYALFLLSALVSLIYLIIGARRKKRRSAFPFILHLAVALVILVIPFTKITLYLDYHLNEKQRNHAVSMILNGGLTPNIPENQSLILLPREIQKLSKGGGEVVVVGEDQSRQILFFTFRGVLDNMSGFVYSEDGNRPSELLLSSDFIEVERYSEHWYWVSAK